MSETSDAGRDDFMAAMWGSFLRWALSEPKMVEAFERETGHTFPAAPKSAIEAMVDEATGRMGGTMEAFVEWATVNQWGLDEAPASYREHLAKKREETARVYGLVDEAVMSLLREPAP